MNIQHYYSNKRILVTGGAGSIGSQLVTSLLSFHPEIVRVLDNNETGLFDLAQGLKSDKIRILIGDIRDKDRLKFAMDNIDIVLHAAALKHVSICEYSPFDAIKTNVLGTQNVLEAALACRVSKVINISTDKAVNPTNVMGTTKLLSERLSIAANYYTGDEVTVYSSVRFGNVLNSRGSVVPIFLRQIRSGGPVTITDINMTRFFMGIPSAVNLILRAGYYAEGKEIFILKMKAVRIIDLALAMIEKYAPLFGFKAEDIRLEFIGKGKGEKIHEDLLTEDEAESTFESDEMLVILPNGSGYQSVSEKAGTLCKLQTNVYNSGNSSFVSKDEIIRELDTIISFD